MKGDLLDLLYKYNTSPEMTLLQEILQLIPGSSDFKEQGDIEHCAQEVKHLGDCVACSNGECILTGGCRRDFSAAALSPIVLRYAGRKSWIVDCTGTAKKPLNSDALRTSVV